MVMAVTGDVGAGKSTVAKLFESLGGFLIDADRVVAELWQTPEVMAAAVDRWGNGILDDAGHVSHKAVAGRIFCDRAEYDWVMKLLHPRVRKEIERRITNPAMDVPTAKTGNWRVVEIPLLFESGVPPWVTVKVFVTASRETRLARCRSRGWDEAELARRESFFMPGEQRMAKSDCVVRNDGSLDELREAVEAVCRRYGIPINFGGGR